jgi:hypothetical protein
MEIARMLQERRWSGTFFLNVYERAQWGDSVMRDIALALQRADQDVELHTHPQWAYNPSQWAMSSYSLDDQTKIVRDGVRMLHAWTGRPVLAHRTGAYAANQDTLTALEQSGVLLDSSYFWQNPNSHLDAARLPRNLPTTIGKVLEIPVTVYLREDRPGLLNSAFAPVSTVRKVDPNWLINGSEMRDAVDAAVANDLPVLVIFLHSFSFMQGGTSGAWIADRRAIDLFRATLDYVASKNLTIVSMRELAAAGLVTVGPAVKDVVPRVDVNVGLSRYAWHRLKGAGIASKVRAAETATLVVVITLLFVGIRRYRANTNSTQRADRRTAVPEGERR